MSTTTVNESRIAKFFHWIAEKLGFGEKPDYEVPKKGKKAEPKIGATDVNRVKINVPSHLRDLIGLEAVDIKVGGKRAALIKLAIHPLYVKDVELPVGFYSNPEVGPGVEWLMLDREIDLLAAHGYASFVDAAAWRKDVGIDRDYVFAVRTGTWETENGELLTRDELNWLVTQLFVYHSEISDNKSEVAKRVLKYYDTITDALYPH